MALCDRCVILLHEAKLGAWNDVQIATEEIGGSEYCLEHAEEVRADQSPGRSMEPARRKVFLATARILRGWGNGVLADELLEELKERERADRQI